jgi:hypothetical protein
MAPRRPRQNREQTAPKRHHIDRRVDQVIADSTGSDDDLLTTAELAEWFGVSVEWLEIGRTKKYGPKFVKLSPRMVRYMRGDSKVWLNERRFSNTGEYP